MKTKILFLSIMLMNVFFITYTSAQTSAFTVVGEWKLNREKTDLQGSQLFLSKIKIELRDSLITTRTYENMNGDEYPFNENVSLDGRDCKIIIYDMPRVSKATFSYLQKTISLESTTAFNGGNGTEDIKAKEEWKTENDGKTLVINTSTNTNAVTTSGTEYFDRVT